MDTFAIGHDSSCKLNEAKYKIEIWIKWIEQCIVLGDGSNIVDV